MQAPRRVWLALALSSIGVTASCESSSRESPPRASADAPQPSPALDLEGQPLDPFADARADLLLFVRTDCPISNRYAPKLGRIAARFADAPLDLWLVYVDPDEQPEHIREHMREYQLPGRALRDPGQSLAARARTRVTPEAALFDAEGALRYHGRIDDWYVDYGKSRSEASTQELVDAVEALLAGREPLVASAEAVGCPLPPLPDVSGK